MTRDDFVKAVAELARSVWDFHERFEILFPCRRSELHSTLVARLPLLDEETGEHARALNRGATGGAIEEMSDVVYIALGTLLVAGDLGVDAMSRNVDKCDSKTPETYAVREGSGKVQKL